MSAKEGGISHTQQDRVKQFYRDGDTGQAYLDLKKGPKIITNRNGKLNLEARNTVRRHQS